MVPAARGAYVRAHSRFQLSVVYTCGSVRGATLGDFGGTIPLVVCVRGVLARGMVPVMAGRV